MLTFVSEVVPRAILSQEMLHVIILPGMVVLDEESHQQSRIQDLVQRLISLYQDFTLEEIFEHNNRPPHLILDSEDDSNQGQYPTRAL